MISIDIEPYVGTLAADFHAWLLMSTFPDVVYTVVEALPQKEHAHDVRTSFPRRRPRTSPLCLFPHSRVGQAPTPGPPFCPLRGDEYLLNGECSRERSKENALWPTKIRDIRLFRGV
jgi:hypothetical protein